MPIFKIALLIGWGVIELSKEMLKNHNLKKEEKLKELKNKYVSSENNSDLHTKK